jgi:hypothetical protein
MLTGTAAANPQGSALFGSRDQSGEDSLAHCGPSGELVRSATFVCYLGLA